MNPRRIASISSVVLTILLIGCASVDVGDSTPPANDGKAPNVRKTYDIRELIEPIANFTDAPDLSRIEDVSAEAPAQPEKQGPDRARRQGAARLVAWISATVSPSLWKAGGVIDEKNGTLTVDAPSATQQELGSLLTDLHRQRNIQITIECLVISLGPKLVDQADPALARKLQIATSPLAMPTATALSDAEFAQILKASGDAPRLGPGRITLFNGQRAYVLATMQRAFVADYVPKKDGKGFDARMKIVEEGLMLDLEATASQDTKLVALKTHLQVSELKGMGRKPFAAAPADKTLMIDVPLLDVRELRATSAIADGATILLGEAQAIPIPADPVDSPAPAKRSRLGEHVFMVVKVKVFEEK